MANRGTSPPHSPVESDPYDITIAAPAEKGETSTLNPPRALLTGESLSSIVNLDAPAKLGLQQMRAGFADVVCKQQIPLKEALHTASLSTVEKKQRLYTEKYRAQMVNKKLTEKRDSHRRTVRKYDRAREASLAARVENTSENSPHHAAVQSSFIVTGE